MVEKVRDGYVGSVGRMIRRAEVSMPVFAGGAACLFRAAPIGFLPLEDKDAFFVNVQLPAGASLARTEAAAERASAMVREVEGVTNVISVAGFSLLGGAPPTPPPPSRSSRPGTSASRPDFAGT